LDEKGSVGKMEVDEEAKEEKAALLEGGDKEGEGGGEGAEDLMATSGSISVTQVCLH
jgi:hypothetical protein